MTSRLIGCVSVLPPGVPVLPPPDATLKMSLFTAPSIWMLLYRTFRPATDNADCRLSLAIWLKYGELRAMSWKLRLIVGRAWMTASEMLSVAPDFDPVKTG